MRTRYWLYCCVYAVVTAIAVDHRIFGGAALGALLCMITAIDGAVDALKR